jgi:hypothetical protein
LIGDFDDVVGCATSIFVMNPVIAGSRIGLHVITFLLAAAGVQFSGLQSVNRSPFQNRKVA